MSSHSPQGADEAIDRPFGVQGDNVPNVQEAGHLIHDSHHGLDCCSLGFLSLSGAQEFLPPCGSVSAGRVPGTRGPKKAPPPRGPSSQEFFFHVLIMPLQDLSRIRRQKWCVAVCYDGGRGEPGGGRIDREICMRLH